MTIEDAAELQLHQRHVLRLEARPPNIEGEGAIPIRDLVRNSLRMRPDRIIVGECRGAEALDMLQAMNTGHDGSLSTVHANAPRDALSASGDDGADGRLRPPGAGDPPAGLLGARPDRPPRAHGGRLAPVHCRHRGAADGVGRDHAAGHLRVQDRVVRPGRHDQRQAPARRACARSSSTSSRSAESSCRPGCSRTGPSRRTSRTSAGEPPGPRLHGRAARRPHGDRRAARRRGRRERRRPGRRGGHRAVPRPCVRADPRRPTGSPRSPRTTSRSPRTASRSRTSPSCPRRRQRESAPCC